MDSKDLIEVCGRAGIQLKNSALASITPEQRDVVMSFMEDTPGGATTATDEEPLAPSRELSRERGKVRTLNKPTSRSATGSDTVDAPPEAGEDVDEQSAPPPAEPVADEVPEVAAEIEPEVVSEPAEVADDSEPAADAEAPDTEVEPDDDGGTEEAPAKRDALSRDDYVPATGARSSRGLREMKPIGTIQESAARRRASAKKESRPQLPALAAVPELPAVKKKPAKKAEEPAQKPVIPLTAEIYEKQGPLGDRLRGKEQRDRTLADTEDGGRGRGRRTGSLLEQRKRERDQEREEKRTTGGGRRSAAMRRRRNRGPAELKTSATIETPISVRSLSETIGRPAKTLLGILFKSGKMVTINEMLNEEEALMLAMEVGVDLEIKRETDIEEVLAYRLDEGAIDSDAELVDRPPIVTILGHVDHGKTSLLDRIRSANVVKGEAGGITQHIAAYQVEKDGRPITFVDTPGHAAFGEMRSRGANVTDIIVLVVAADDGVMPQTEECISHAKAAGVPVVVAMNKVDLPDRDEQKVLQGLTNHELLPVEWGGEIEVVRTSAESGQGIDDLLETILLTAELHEYKTNADQPAVGVCLEGFRDEGRGALAWMIVQRGTLEVGDDILCGETYGRVRALYTDRDEELQSAGPSTPVKVAGLNGVPGAGDHFFVMDDIENAREVAEQRHHRDRAEQLARRRVPLTLENLLGSATDGQIRDLPLIIKADTPGSLEALRGEIAKFEHPEVRVQTIHEGVGGVNESDVYLASAAGAIIVAFHVIAEDRAALLAEAEGVDIRRYNIIYEITESIRQALEGLLRPEIREVATGRALVLRTFSISRFGTIAGCRIINGTIERNSRCHVIRDQKLLRDYPIASLRREKDDVKEVREGMECGIRLDGFNDVKEGDLLEAFRVEEIQRTLES